MLTLISWLFDFVSWCYQHADLFAAIWLYGSVALVNLWALAHAVARHTETTTDDVLIAWVDAAIARITRRPAPKPEDILPPVPVGPNPNAPAEPKRPILDLLGKLLGRK